MSEELIWMDGHVMADLIQAKKLSPTEAVEAVLKQLAHVEPSINAFVTVTAELALAAAKRAEQALISNPGDVGPLHGVPITVKDLDDTAQVRTTYGSAAFADHVPDQDAVGWARLKAAGAILIGKTTTPDFGMLGVTESSLTGVTRNPWDPQRTSGGSSGGAAASVAAGVAPFAWGSDGGGSIRVPAACCGVVGLKASMGRIPNCGPNTSVWESVGVVGPVTRSVRDSALLLSVAAGPHERYPYSLPVSARSFVEGTINPAVGNLKIAFTPDFGTAEIDHDVRGVIDAAVRVLVEDGGARVDAVDITLPDPIDYFQAFWSPEFASVLGDPTGNGQTGNLPMHPVMEAIARHAGTIGALEYYKTAHETRGLILDGFLEVFSRYDLIVTPTMPVTAFPHPGDVGGNTHVNGNPVSQPMIDFHRLTEPASHVGLPSITVPCGFSPDGMPVGLQIIGPQHADAAVLAAAAAFESLTDHHTRRPPLAC